MYILYEHKVDEINKIDIPMPEGFYLFKSHATIKLLFSKKISLTTYIYSLLSHGDFLIYWVYDKMGEVAHHSTVAGPSIRYNFMEKDEYMINQASTLPKYRGRGIYPYVLNQIMIDNENKKHYIYVAKDNISSQRGVKKVGFHQCGFIDRKKKFIRGIFKRV